MCNFKSAIFLKNKVVLAPEGNESHSNLLDSLGIEDNYLNASKVFVRAELIPPNKNKARSIDEWEYRVDHDITPDWYVIEPERYELEMRKAVKEYMKDKLQNIICGYDWTPIQDGDLTYYFMNGILFESRFGKNNDYKTSDVREKLQESDLLADLKKDFGDRLVPISLDLTSMDGCKDYGKCEGDLLAIPNVELLMKFGDKIPLVDNWYWLATPNQTLSRGDSAWVRCVCSGGRVFYDDCRWCDGAVRPFFILRSSEN